MNTIKILTAQLTAARARVKTLAARLATAKKQAAKRRAAIVAWGRWGVAHEPQIHYLEKRPMPLTAKLPLTTDCSGFVTLCYHLAGAPDPNGLGYNGQGFTGTLLQHGRTIDEHSVVPGDVVVYGGGTGHHTALCITPGPNPMTVSHGQERGPILITVEAESRYQPPGITYLRFPTV